MEPLVTIAIPDLAGPAARDATLASLIRHTPEPYGVLVFVEDRSAAGDTIGLHSTPPRPYGQIFTPAPFSAPAALNQLLTVCTTPYILLLESGAIVTSCWLERLLAPLSD